MNYGCGYVERVHFTKLCIGIHGIFYCVVCGESSRYPHKSSVNISYPQPTHN